MKEKVFVSGATGLVGLAVVKRLVQSGFPVVASVRSSSKTDELKKVTGAGQLSIATADLADSNSLRAAMHGCQVIVHCAGSVDPHALKQDIVATNVAGTSNCLKAADDAGARQFIHISSLSVITGQNDQFDVDETAPLRYCGEAYADSKVDAEKLVSAAKGSIQTTILRPGFIYGPGERAWMPRLIGNLKSGKVMLIDGGLRKTNVIYVSNLAQAVENSILNQSTYGQVYNLTDDGTPSKKELFDTICDSLHLARVNKRIPRPAAKLVCELVSMVAPYLPPSTKQNLSRFSRAAFRLAAVNQGFSIAKAKRDLNLSGFIPFEKGMKETLLIGFGAPTTSMTASGMTGRV